MEEPLFLLRALRLFDLLSVPLDAASLVDWSFAITSVSTGKFLEVDSTSGSVPAPSMLAYPPFGSVEKMHNVNFHSKQHMQYNLHLAVYI